MLVGIGLGPGDEELLTLKAVRLLKEADKVFVPGKMALDIVSKYTKAEVLEFPMTNDESVIEAALKRNAEKIAPYARSGTAVLGIIGDPSFYSTFSRQCEVMNGTFPDIDYMVVPGISSITAFASRSGLSLSGCFIVTDGPSSPEAMVMLKVKQPRKRMEELKLAGYRHFVLTERMFLDGERVFIDRSDP